MNDMENESISTALENALKKFQEKNNQVPEGYFDQFEQQLMRKIQGETSAPKKATIFAIIGQQKKYLVAASLLFAIAAGYLSLNKTANNTSPIAQVETIEIETLPDEIIESYVNNNELIAELEWNTAIENTAASVSLNNN